MTKRIMDKKTQQKLLDLVKRNYDQIAGDFNETRTNRVWPELIKLTEPVKDGDRILDVGCGNGRLLKLLVNKKIDYVGVDSSKKLIEIASKNFQFSIFNFQTNHNFQFSNKINSSPEEQSKKFILGDILELDKLAEKDFDYVFCIAVLHHLPGEELRVEALKQMKTKIKPDGKIILTVWNLWTQAKFRILILKFAILKMLGRNRMDFGDILFDWKNNLGQGISQRYYHAFTEHELKAISEGAGLKLEKLYKDKYNYYAILSKK